MFGVFDFCWEEESSVKKVLIYKNDPHLLLANVRTTAGRCRPLSIALGCDDGGGVGGGGDVLLVGG